jgi:hypothetical protein
MTGVQSKSPNYRTSCSRMIGVCAGNVSVEPEEIDVVVRLLFGECQYNLNCRVGFPVKLTDRCRNSQGSV